MAETMHSKILGRMAGRVTDDVDHQPLTASRAVRLAVTKTANDTVGLVLTVISMAEEIQPLDGLIAALGDDLMLVGLYRDGQLAGVIALDVELRAAILEMQTAGSLIGAPAEKRRATGTDKTLCDPLLDALVQALSPAMAGTELDGWISDCTVRERIDSARAAGLVLSDRDYRILRLAVDLGVADREALLLIALPPVKKPDLIVPELVEDVDWAAQFRLAVSFAPGTLLAHLKKFTIPLSQARSLEVGQILPLPGCDVHSVRLVAPDGKMVAQAKLGQLGGMRAIRIEQAPQAQMGDLTPVGCGFHHATSGGADGRVLNQDGGKDSAFQADHPIEGTQPSPKAADEPHESELAADMDFPMAKMDNDGLSGSD